MDFGQRVSARIRELRKQKNTTQEKLSEKIGMDLTSYSRIERGTNSNIRVNTLARIITALDVDYPTFFNFTDSEIPQERIFAKLALVEDERDEVMDIIEKIIDLKLK